MTNLSEIKITPRDRQVLQLLVQGCSNKEIAAQLDISPRTVKQHLRTLFLRAGIKEGRKRVRLATAMFQKEQMEIMPPRDRLTSREIQVAQSGLGRIDQPRYRPALRDQRAGGEKLFAQHFRQARRLEPPGDWLFTLRAMAECSGGTRWIRCRAEQLAQWPPRREWIKDDSFSRSAQLRT